MWCISLPHTNTAVKPNQHSESCINSEAVQRRLILFSFICDSAAAAQLDLLKYTLLWCCFSSYINDPGQTSTLRIVLILDAELEDDLGRLEAAAEWTGRSWLGGRGADWELGLTGGDAAGQMLQHEGREHKGNEDQHEARISQPYTDEVTREQRANRRRRRQGDACRVELIWWGPGEQLRLNLPQRLTRHDGTSAVCSQ